MPFLVTPVRNNKSLLGKTKTGGEPNGKGKSMERQNTAVVAQSLVVQLKQDPYVFNPRSCWPQWIQYLRCETYLITEMPESGKFAAKYSTGMFVMIILSIVAFVLEAEPWLMQYKQVWTVAEAFFSILFSVELVIRWWSCTVAGTETNLAFPFKRGNVCDALAVLPFYIDNAITLTGGDPNGASAQMTGMFRVLRAFRLGRVFRLFRHSKHFAQMRVMTDTFASSSQALYVLAFLCMMSAVIFSSLLYFMEKLQCNPALEKMSDAEYAEYDAACANEGTGWHPDGSVCCTRGLKSAPYDFTSIPATFWWAAVTMTTVGFGDKLPRTLAGRIIAGITMMAGILVIALPVAIVGSRFQEVYNEVELQKRLKREKESEEGLKSNMQDEIENESLLYEKINEHPALSALARRVKRRLQRLRASVDDQPSQSSGQSATDRDANRHSDVAAAKALLVKLEALLELDNEKVVAHATRLRQLINQSLTHQDILKHLEERESFLHNAVQHQYKDLMQALDGTFFPWPKRAAEAEEKKDNRFTSEAAGKSAKPDASIPRSTRLSQPYDPFESSATNKAKNS
jgi:hypothetical protein